MRTVKEHYISKAHEAHSKLFFIPSAVEKEYDI